MDETPAFEERIIALIAEIVPGKFKKTRITRDMRLQRDLGLDSLGTASLMFRLEGEFGLDLGAVGDLAADVGALRSVGDVVDFAKAIRLESDPSQGR
jgi:acyl carrier protein